MRHTLTFSGLSSVVLLVVRIIYKSEIAMTLIFWIRNRKIRKVATDLHPYSTESVSAGL